MRAKSKAGLIKNIKKVMNEIADKRDELRDLAEDALAVVGDCEEAYNALESAVDTLSQRL
jgi:predicted  nucleic acid-binding Zn-ribbon protein